MKSNFDTALKAEAKKVIRRFHKHSIAECVHYIRNPRSGSVSVDGRFHYTHPDFPGLSFPRRFCAAHYALAHATIGRGTA